MTLLIKDAKLIQDGQEIITHIYIENGKIKSIGDFIKADIILDAEKGYVIPGCIDPHVHARDFQQKYKEDFYTASMAAAVAGVTTMLCMPNTKPAITSRIMLDKARSKAAASLVNYGFHIGATKNNLRELRKAKNIASIKAYMGSTTGNLLVRDKKTLASIFSLKRLVSVHAEDDAIIYENQLKYEEKEDVSYHGKIRSVDSAVSSTVKAIFLASKYNCPLYICHVSTKDEIDFIELARKNGNKIFAEATPHHLFLNETETKKRGNYVKVNPPLRSRAHQTYLLNNIHLFDTVGTDHAPHTIEEKKQIYSKAPSGLPGLETLLPLLLDAVVRKKITISQLVRLTSINPAKIFGIKNKARIVPGYDADLVIVSLDKETKIDASKLRTKCRWSPWNKKTLKGKVETTIVGGNIVYDGEEIFDFHKGKEVRFKT